MSDYLTNAMRFKSVFLLIGLLSLCGSRGEESKETAAGRTQFFQQFSSKPFPDKYAEYFTRVTEKGSRNGLVFSQPTSKRRDTFKDFRISGVIDADQLDRMLGALEIELKAALEKAGGASDGDLRTNISDRPIYLLAYLFADGVNCRELGGFYLPYKGGSLTGEIDVFVGRRTVGDQIETTVVCAIHEAATTAE